MRLIPPRYVTPYVKRNKNDMADAEAICEAVNRLCAAGGSYAGRSAGPYGATCGVSAHSGT